MKSSMLWTAVAVMAAGSSAAAQTRVSFGLDGGVTLPLGDLGRLAASGPFVSLSARARKIGARTTFGIEAIYHTVLKSQAQVIAIDANTNSVSTKTQPFVAIPYYSWAHRGEGEMMVWLPQKISAVDIISK